MKRIILLALVALSSAGFAQKVNFKIKGSDTVLPLTQKEAEVFMKNNPGSSIMVTGGGSGVGISALLTGSTDIAQSSRSLKLDEKMKLNEAGKAFTEKIIAYDALAVIVHPSNPVSKLTREQLEGIFTGKIRNWKEVGGTDMNIVSYSRETSSGTYEFFKEHVLNRKNFSPTALLMPATGAIVQSVSQTKGAIGYVGLAYLEKSIKPLLVSFDQGKTYSAPSVETAKNKKYPISRPLYYYYLKTSEKSVSPFVNFILSPEGQKTVLDEGYVPLN
ncbi:MAG: PstS family phosphate ABC transporter substrate-binding protein [Bacteroidota bacterium]